MDATQHILFSVFGLPVTAYALCLAVSLGAGLLCFFRLGKKKALLEDALWRCALLSLPLGLLGARLFYCLSSFYLYEEVGLDAIFRFWEGGYCLWGAVAGAALAAFLAAKSTRQPAAPLLDALAVSGALVIALARLAEYFSGEGIGPYVENEALQFFPLAVFRADYEIWYLAVFVLEALAALAIFLILLRRQRPAGHSARLFLLLYSACQLTLESLRRDHAPRWLFVRVNQLTAILVIVGLMLFALIRWARAKEKPLSGKRAAFLWGTVAVCAGIIVAMEFSFDGKILQDLPVWAGYGIMALSSLGIGAAAHSLIFSQKA